MWRGVRNLLRGMPWDFVPCTAERAEEIRASIVAESLEEDRLFDEFCKIERPLGLPYKHPETQAWFDRLHLYIRDNWSLNHRPPEYELPKEGVEE